MNGEIIAPFDSILMNRNVCVGGGGGGGGVVSICNFHVHEFHCPSLVVLI